MLVREFQDGGEESTYSQHGVSLIQQEKVTDFLSDRLAHEAISDVPLSALARVTSIL